MSPKDGGPQPGFRYAGVITYLTYASMDGYLYIHTVVAPSQQAEDGFFFHVPRFSLLSCPVIIPRSRSDDLTSRERDGQARGFVYFPRIDEPVCGILQSGTASIQATDSQRRLQDRKKKKKKTSPSRFNNKRDLDGTRIGFGLNLQSLGVQPGLKRRFVPIWRAAPLRNSGALGQASARTGRVVAWQGQIASRLGCLGRWRAHRRGAHARWTRWSLWTTWTDRADRVMVSALFPGRMTALNPLSIPQGRVQRLAMGPRWP